jgi:type I restriction enzyme, R subunit
VSIFDSRTALGNEMRLRNTGGFFITTIQKFAESTGLLSERANIICMSDEAHRSQNNLGQKLVINADASKGTIGARTTNGFATYLRKALPNATYVGFTGTPIDETVHVFGDIVDQYTMKESEEDGITVPIKYNPRLARVFMNSDEAAKVEEYYRQCAEEGSNAEVIKKSKKAMSSMMVILDNEDRLKRVAADIVTDYKSRLQTTNRVQKAMVTCADREIAFKLYQAMKEVEPSWFEPKKALNELTMTSEELAKLHEVAYANLVCTRDANDPKALYNALGDKEHRKFLDAEFKSTKSNFRIAIVVDMWITGFDVPSLTVLYNDKPLSKHTLIQTISRVNRKYKDKECGFVVDYLGIREEMKKAMKRYGGDDTPKEDLVVAHEIFTNELKIVQEMLVKLDYTPFFGDNNLARLQFLQTAAEYILANTVEKKGTVSFMKRFVGHVKRLRSAYNILNPAGELTEDETKWAQCFMGICSFVQKMTSVKHDATEMNRHVEKMVQQAIFSSGVEPLLNEKGKEENIFGDEFVKELADVKMPYTKFQLLVKLISKAISAYKKVNKVQAEKFQIMLEKIIDDYNTRDNLTFTNEVARDTVNELSARILKLFRELNADKEKFKELGVSFEEKAFYDVLVNVRDNHGFEYSDERCIELARKIKTLVDDVTIYADFANNNNLKSKLSIDLTYLIYKEGYPPQWDQEVFQKVLEQVQNYKDCQ